MIGGKRRLDQKDIDMIINSKYQPPQNEVIAERTFEDSKLNHPINDNPPP